MRKQQQVWLKEHTDKQTLPSMADMEPGSGVVGFVEWLRKNRMELLGRAIDIGAGKGRNSVYLASLGYEVYAVDYIKPAIDVARALAKQNGVEGKIHFLEKELDKPWRFDDNFFDIAIDSFSSIDIETFEGRKVYRDEMYRTLKPGGYAMVAVCSADDEWEKELIAEHPGPERNSTVWPQNGKFQKDYTEEELRDFYKKFKIIELKKVKKPARKLGRNGIATNLWLLLQK